MLLAIDFMNIRILDVLDVLLVVYLIYALYNLLKGTAAINILFGIFALYLIWRLVRVFEMELLTEILGAFISVGFIALIVVFQPEIRRFLLVLGTPKFNKIYRKRFLFWKSKEMKKQSFSIIPIMIACKKFSKLKIGSIIAVKKNSGLQQYINTGQLIDAEISEALLTSIFFKNNPLHDGAVVIHKNRIVAAGCVLPVSKKTDIPKKFGLRHRAALGLSENSDALIIVTSEETGNISLFENGQINYNITTEKLSKALQDNFME